MAYAAAAASGAGGASTGPGPNQPDVIKAVRHYVDKMIPAKGRSGGVEGMKVLLLDNETVRLCWTACPASDYTAQGAPSAEAAVFWERQRAVPEARIRPSTARPAARRVSLACAEGHGFHGHRHGGDSGARG